MRFSTGGICFAFCAAIAILPLSAPVAASGISDARQIAQAAPPSALVQRVQEALVGLGYDPGPADGLIGDRTTRSVEAFQRRAGLPVDGRVTEPLYRALQAAIAAPATPAADAAALPAPSPSPVAMAAMDNTVPNAAAAAGATFVNSVWTITDPGGATLTLRLLDDGKIGDVESPAFWKWQLRGNEIRINYDNKLGGWVERRGKIVTANELRGDANSSRKREWTWRARRNVATR